MAIPLIAPNDVIRATYFQRNAGQFLQTILHLRCVTAPTGSTYLAQLGGLVGSLKLGTSFPLANWLPLVGPQQLFDEVRVQRVYPQRDPYLAAAVGLVGTNVDPSLTPNVAVSIEKRTLIRGRKGVGRIQMAGAPDTKMVAGLWDGTYAASVQSAWANLELLYSVVSDSSVWAWCVWNGESPVTSDYDIWDVQTKIPVRTMHRRTVGLGI